MKIPSLKVITLLAFTATAHAEEATDRNALIEHANDFGNISFIYYGERSDENITRAESIASNVVEVGEGLFSEPQYMFVPTPQDIEPGSIQPITSEGMGEILSPEEISLESLEGIMVRELDYGVERLSESAASVDEKTKKLRNLIECYETKASIEVCDLRFAQ